MNCDIYLKPSLAGIRDGSTHRFGFVDGTGAGGVAVDTRFDRSQDMIDRNIAAEVSWDRAPQSATTRGYQNNVTLRTSSTTSAIGFFVAAVTMR